MTIGNWLSIIGLCFTLFFSGFALFFSIKNNRKSDNNEIKTETKEHIQESADRAKEYAVIGIKLDNINITTNEIKNQISAVSKDVKEHGNQIIILEERTKAMHERQDTMEKRLDKLEV